MKTSLSLLTINVLLLGQAFAGSVSPSPRQTTVLSKNAVPSGAAGIIVNSSCYGTNNRGTTNPMSPASRIFIHVKPDGGESFLIDFPSALVTPKGGDASAKCGITKLTDDSLDLSGTPKTIDALMASSGSGGAEIVEAFKLSNLDASGNRTAIDCQKFPISFGMNLQIDEKATYRAIQVFDTTMSAQAFYGYNGVMDRGAKINVKQSEKAGGYSDSNQFIQITAAFPGQDGFCGGFHSPLMFFFTEKFPAFTGSTTLLKGEKDATSWVEENHEGYFLVQLKKPDSVVTADSLFGDTNDFKNGFDALIKLDSNNDKVIDKKDKNFKKLYLWKDINGNAKNDKGEMKSLADHKISSIDLDYNNEYRIERNKTVFKGRSTFNFVDEKGNKGSGQIFDVFFESLGK